MQWLVKEVVGPLARRVGGQVAAVAVALGMADQHEAALAAIVAWAVITVAELAVDHKSRRAVLRAAVR